MIKFEAGKSYYQMTLIGVSAIAHAWTVVKRTEKTATITNGRETRRCKINEKNGREHILPYGRFSMAPIIGALGCISNNDEDAVDRYILDKLGKDYSDYEDEDGDIDWTTFYSDGDRFLTDEAYKEIISSENGNAYYHDWYYWNDGEFCECE